MGNAQLKKISANPASRRNAAHLFEIGTFTTEKGAEFNPLRACVAPRLPRAADMPLRPRQQAMRPVHQI
jgi:hypothetical protein